MKLIPVNLVLCKEQRVDILEGARDREIKDWRHFQIFTNQPYECFLLRKIVFKFKDCTRRLQLSIYHPWKYHPTVLEPLPKRLAETCVICRV